MSEICISNIQDEIVALEDRTSRIDAEIELPSTFWARRYELYLEKDENEWRCIQYQIDIVEETLEMTKTTSLQRNLLREQLRDLESQRQVAMRGCTRRDQESVQTTRFH